MADELPPTDRLPATSLLVEGGEEIDRIALLDTLGDGLDAALELFDREGFTPFVARYSALDGLAGHAITLKLPHESLSGTAVGIDAIGQLLLRLPDGSEQAFSAGEVERVLD
jgi:BirA family biotin operon repressor/biotin-[acetyl-CoA-carboxylase] ligase